MTAEPVEWLEEWYPFEEWQQKMRATDSGERMDAADKPPPGPVSEVVALLERALEDPDEMVRLCAAEGLGHFPVRASREALVRFLATPQDALASSVAAFSLAMVGELSDGGALIEHRGLAGSVQDGALPVLAIRHLFDHVQRELTATNADPARRARAVNLVRNVAHECARAADQLAAALETSPADPASSDNVEALLVALEGFRGE